MLMRATFGFLLVLMQDRLSASIVYKSPVMTEKSVVVHARVPPEIRARLEGLAAEAGVHVSGVLRALIEDAVRDTSTQKAPPLLSRARREGKVTVRLAADVRDRLEREAKGQGVSLSTWAAAVIGARARHAPQPVPSERRTIQAAFRQLRGLAVNVNQIAYALNRGVLTGAAAELTREEVTALRQDVSALRDVLRTYAAGRLSFQAPHGDGDE
uniref:Bacterial mobilisation domain-containing protein n=1 Tax=Cereibacter sphaeroides (strain ATCC 17025 / ATH 2.4.3) TaxID=349102 RepID=A4X0N9_CERS5